MGTAASITEQNILLAFKEQEHFVKCLLDAWVLIDANGKAVKSNQLFAQLVGESTRKVLKAESIDQLLGMAINGRDFGFQELLKVDGPTRIDEVSAKTAKREGLTLILGIFPYIDRSSDQLLGAFLLIRDVTDDKALHDKYKTTKTDSITDRLTGLYTRRHFENYLTTQEQLAKSEEKMPVMSLIMIDIDHFKKVNDVHGHAAGDAILKTMGEIVSKTFRKSDITCRYGGEEFLVILPQTPIHGASVAAEQLRKAVEERRIVFDGTHIPITISSGVATFDFINEPYKETLVRADEALYKAKEQGRNQVQINFGESHIAPYVEKPGKATDRS